jgi:hypothetical protein
VDHLIWRLWWLPEAMNQVIEERNEALMVEAFDVSSNYALGGG